MYTVILITMQPILIMEYAKVNVGRMLFWALKWMFLSWS